MQATITYTLSEQAQRAQMAATGQPVARQQSKTVQISPEDMILMDVDSIGALTLDLTATGTAEKSRCARKAIKNDWTSYGAPAVEINPYDADILALIRQGIAAHEDEEATAAEVKAKQLADNTDHNRQLVEQAYQAFVADPKARYETSFGRVDIPGLRTPSDYFSHHHEALMAEAKRRNAADVQAKQATDKAKEEAKQQFLDAWVNGCNDETLKRQYADGLLSRHSLVCEIAQESLAALGLIKHEVTLCDDSECKCGIRDVEAISKPAYSVWIAIKDTLPKDTAVTFERSRDCYRGSDGEFDGDECSQPYYTALVKVPVGPFVFERRISLA